MLQPFLYYLLQQRITPKILFKKKGDDVFTYYTGHVNRVGKTKGLRENLPKHLKNIQTRHTQCKPL